MRKKSMIYVTVGFIALFILLGDFTITYSNSKRIYTMEFNGIVWVYLDYRTIRKYDSIDEPSRILSFSNTKKQAK